jgi:hypothetical protein
MLSIIPSRWVRENLFEGNNMSMTKRVLKSAVRIVLCAVAGSCLCPMANARTDDKPTVPVLDLPADQFEKFHAMIKPIPGEMSWRTEIPWLTNLTEARAKAAAEGKPILVWMSADGHPLGAS